MTTVSAEAALALGAALLPSLPEPLRSLWQRMMLEAGRLLRSADAGETLLPRNATATELRLEQSTKRMGNLPTPLRELWNPNTCPQNLLPWLAWAFQIDVWDANWSEATQRQAVRGAIDVHRRKGTPWAIRRALENAGYGDAVLQEGDATQMHDGTLDHHGEAQYIGDLDWANYRVMLAQPITNAQAAQVRQIMGFVAPVRCHLVGLVFTEIANIHNASARYDGTYNHGTA